jgi:hypothetical protein
MGAPTSQRRTDSRSVSYAGGFSPCTHPHRRGATLVPRVRSRGRVRRSRRAAATDARGSGCGAPRDSPTAGRIRARALVRTTRARRAGNSTGAARSRTAPGPRVA